MGDKLYLLCWIISTVKKKIVPANIYTRMYRKNLIFITINKHKINFDFLKSLKK